MSLFLALTTLFAVLLFYQRRKLRFAESLLKDIGEGVYSVEKNGRCSWINQKALDMLGFKKEEIIGKDQHILFHHHKICGNEYSVYDCPIYLTLQDKKHRETQDYFIRKDGSFFPVNLTVTPKGKESAIVIFRDITELKGHQKDLEEERNLFSSGPVVTIEWDPSFNWPIRYVSGNCINILGYTQEEMKQSSFVYANIIHPDDVHRIFKEVAYNMQNRIDIFEQSYRLRLKNKEYRWFYDFTKFVRDQSGEIVSIIGYFFDQSVLKDTEKELQNQKEKLSNIIEGTNVGTWEWNIETGETIFDEKWAQTIGYTLKELEPIGIDTWIKFAHPDDLKKSGEILEKHFRGELPYYSCESRMRHKNGSWVWVLDRGKVSTWDASGKPLVMYGTHQDITQIKNTQEELEKNKRLLELFFRQSQTGFFFMMLDKPVEWNENTNKEKVLEYVFTQQKVTKVNDAMLRQYKAKREDFIGRTPADFFAHDIKHGKKVWRDFFDTGHLHIDTREKRFDGSDMIVNGNYICLYDDQSRITGHFGVQQDVTQDRKNQESLVEAKAKAEAANNAKSYFLANMSHEIRTPINAITGLGELMLDTSLDARQKDLLYKINGSSKMLLGIINDILDHSKIESGKLELEYTDFSLEEIIEQLQVMFYEAALKKSLILRYSIQKNVPKFIFGDELRLTQVLINLISNAIKFTPKGEVSLDISLKEKIDQNRALINFCVTDTGIGITQEQIEKLFTPFTQADTSTTRKYGGTGLGLSISKKILEAMHSKLFVESKKNQGSKFFFDLEAEVLHGRKKEKKYAKHRKENLNFKGTTVLLIEDNALNQEVVSMMLRRSSIEVDIANNGKEGVEAYLKYPKRYAMILMDLQMPLMSGYEAAKIIKEHNQQVPIIALSAAATSQEKRKAFDAGMNDYLTKPINTTLLYKLLSKYLHIQIHDEIQVSKNNTLLDKEYLQTLFNSREALQKALKTFFNELDVEFNDIALLLQNKNKKSKSQIHSLKGVSGNMGAALLYTISQKIDTKLTHKQTISVQEIKELQDAIERTKKEISKHLLKERNGFEKLDEKLLKTLFEEIKRHLLDSTAIESEKLETLLANVKEKIDSDQIAACRKYVETFEYEKALEVIEKWKI